MWYPEIPQEVNEHPVIIQNSRTLLKKYNFRNRDFLLTFGWMVTFTAAEISPVFSRVRFAKEIISCFLGKSAGNPSHVFASLLLKFNKALLPFFSLATLPAATGNVKCRMVSRVLCSYVLLTLPKKSFHCGNQFQ